MVPAPNSRVSEAHTLEQELAMANLIFTRRRNALKLTGDEASNGKIPSLQAGQHSARVSK